LLSKNVKAQGTDEPEREEHDMAKDKFIIEPHFRVRRFPVL